MATATQRKRLRGDIGATEASLPNTEADAIYTEAAEDYSTADEIKAYTRVIAIQRLLASSAKLTTYKQNQSSENLSDVYKHLESLLKIWETKLSKAEASGRSVVKFGRSRNIPRRVVEFPDNSESRRTW